MIISREELGKSVHAAADDRLIFPGTWETASEQHKERCRVIGERICQLVCLAIAAQKGSPAKDEVVLAAQRFLNAWDNPIQATVGVLVDAKVVVEAYLEEVRSVDVAVTAAVAAERERART